MKTKEMKGITLVALVVTIVVLLILAGVSINTVLGDDGIIEKAKEKAEATRRASAEEEMNRLVLEYQLAKNDETLESFLQEKVTEGRIDGVTDNGDGTITITKKVEGKDYTITVKKPVAEPVKPEPVKPEPVKPEPVAPTPSVTEYKNRTIEENYNAIFGLTKKLFDYRDQAEADTEDYKTAECGCGKYNEIFDKAVEMGLATTYTEADKIEEMGKDASGKDVVKEAMIVPIVEPSMVYYEFVCSNQEQKPGGAIPMPYALNYEITFDGKKYFDSGKPSFDKTGGDFELAYAWLGQDWVDKGYTMFSARAAMYPSVPLSELGQIYHIKVQVVTANNFRKAIRALNLDLRQYSGLCAHPIS